MSVPQGCTDDRDVVESFKEALEQRIGSDRFRMWFTHGVSFAVADEPASGDSASDVVSAETPVNESLIKGCVLVRVRGQFALDRLRKNFLTELRGAAMQACGSSTHVAIELATPPASQASLPLATELGTQLATQLGTEPTQAVNNLAASTTAKPRRSELNRRTHRSGGPSRGKTMSMSSLISHGAGTVRNSNSGNNRKRSHAPAGGQMELPSLQAGDANDGELKQNNSGSSTDKEKSGVATRRPMTVQTFVAGSCNQLAYTAMTMVCQQPGLASPLFVCGPTGTGKTHMLASIADQLRRRHRMRRVMHLSAEQFTNDFITSVGNSGITSFRRRYREVDALLIDDVQFLGSKKATLREMLYTVETLAEAGRPLIFSGSQSPTEISGLTHELAGRMAAGLVCPLGPLDMSTRETILRRWLGETCSMPIEDNMIEQLTSMLAGDGRVISGVVNTINLLQRMYGRTPTMDEIRRFGGDVLRSAKPVASLSVIETAVCEAFQLPLEILRSGAQTRVVTEPRMLAMYLSRQMTSAAYTEIARHFGGKSHSTAIAAEKNVKGWIEKGKSIGRGPSAMSAQEAIDRIENLLRA